MRFLAVAAACIALAGCRTAPRSVRIDPALATMVPPGAVLLAGIRLDRLRTTPAWEKHLASSPIPMLDDAGRVAGLDLRRDIWEVLVVSDGAHTAAFARGKFGEQGIEPRISAQAARMAHKGVTVVGSENESIAFLTASTAVAGRRDAVLWAIDQRDSATGPPRELADLIARIPPENQIWAVASGSRAPALGGNAANFTKMLSLSETALAAVHVTTGARLWAELTGRSEQDAIQLNDALGALAGFARLTTRDAALARALESLHIQRRDGHVTITAELAADQLQKLLP